MISKSDSFIIGRKSFKEIAEILTAKGELIETTFDEVKNSRYRLRGITNMNGQAVYTYEAR